MPDLSGASLEDEDVCSWCFKSTHWRSCRQYEDERVTSVGPVQGLAYVQGAIDTRLMSHILEISEAVL